MTRGVFVPESRRGFSTSPKKPYKRIGQIGPMNIRDEEDEMDKLFYRRGGHPRTLNPEQVFFELLSDTSDTDNNYCVDCGWKLLPDQPLEGSEQLLERIHELRKIHVSLNHGILLCGNCAQIHQQSYSTDVSFIKPIINDQIVDWSSPFGHWRQPQL